MPTNPHEWQLLFTGVVIGMIVSVVFGTTMFIYSVRSVAANIRVRYPNDARSPDSDTQHSPQRLYLYESEQFPFYIR